MKSTIVKQQSDLIQSNFKISSLMIAEKFGKRHDNIIRAIEKLELEEEYHHLNFEEKLQTVAIGNGAQKQTKTYEITRDGFSLLVMGFTGKRAMEWKIKFLEAFKMLENQNSTPKLGYSEFKAQFISDKGALEIQKTINDMVEVMQLPKDRKGVVTQYYTMLKNHFEVSKYKNIPRDGYGEAINLIFAFRPVLKIEQRSQIGETISVDQLKELNKHIAIAVENSWPYSRVIRDSAYFKSCICSEFELVGYSELLARDFEDAWRIVDQFKFSHQQEDYIILRAFSSTDRLSDAEQVEAGLFKSAHAMLNMVREHPLFGH